MDSAVAWGTFWTSVAIAIAGFAALYLNGRLLAAHTDPDVVIYTSPDDSRPTVIVLVIENIGRGMAYDVRFSTSPEPIPCKVWGVSKKAARPPEGFNLGPLHTGIPALGPGAKRVMAWGQYAALREFLGDRTIDVTVTYRGKGYLTHSPSEHVSPCQIEVFSHGYTDAVDSDGARQSARELKRIAEAVNALVRRLPPEPPQTPEQMKATLELMKGLYSSEDE